MNACEILYQAAGRPHVEGLMDAAMWQGYKGKDKPSAPPQVCYLTGGLITEGVIASTRLGDTWTAHDTAAAPFSEWLSAAAIFSLSEAVTHPSKEKPFKMRAMTHLVLGESWTVLGLGDKAKIAQFLLNPPSEAWLLSICDAPLAASHAVYKAVINTSLSRWSVGLGKLTVAGSPKELAEMLTVVEAMYPFHGKGQIELGNYHPKNIIAQSEGAWAKCESQVSAWRGKPLFELALFLAQKEQ